MAVDDQSVEMQKRLNKKQDDRLLSCLNTDYPLFNPASLS